jgi:hypothetical protein
MCTFLLPDRGLLGLLFKPEDGSGIFLQEVSGVSMYYMAQTNIFSYQIHQL